MACSRSLVPSLKTRLGELRGRKLFVNNKHVNAYLGIKVRSSSKNLKRKIFNPYFSSKVLT